MLRPGHGRAAVRQVLACGSAQRERSDKGVFMVRKLILVTVGLALLLSGCTGSGSGNAAENLTNVSLPMGYIANIQYAPFYVALD